MDAIVYRIKAEKYPAYRDSGEEWLRDIPKHWEIKKLKFLGRIYPGLSGKKGTDFSKEYVEGMKSFIPFTNICNNRVISEKQYQYVVVKEFEQQKTVQCNDILFLMSSETLEEIAKCSLYIGTDKELYLNSFCKGFRISNSALNPSYVNYLFSSLSYRHYFSLVGRGFTRINVKQEFINDAYILVPTIEEQNALAEFLDLKMALIDQAIDIKEMQIKLLRERRQILIHKAVTRGLNPDVKMKECGMEWIGEIPEHWIEIANRGLFEERNEPGNDTLNILSVSIHTAVSSQELSDDENLRGKIRIDDKRNYKLVKPNDIAFNMMRAWQGAIGAVRVDGMVSPAYIVAKPKRKVNADYLEYLFRTKDFIGQMDRHSKGITDFRKRLYWTEFKQLKVFLPPMEEQNSIVEYISVFSNKIQEAVSFKEKEIEKLKEYKATLINSAVTGKIKVC